MAHSTIADRFTPVDIAHVALAGTIGGHVDSATKRLCRGQIDAYVKLIEQGETTGGWNGCYAGWWLEAAINSWKYTQDALMRAVIDDTVNRLLASQQEDGYIGDYAPGLRFYQQDWNNLHMEPGWPPSNMAQFDVWDSYCTMFGLTKYFEIAGDRRALDAARRLANLIIDTFGEDKQDIMKVNFDYGHISGCVIQGLAYLYGVTGEQRYLDFCQYVTTRYAQQDTVPIVVTENRSSGYPFKATTPKVKHMEFEYHLTALCELYRYTGENKWLVTCRNLYDGYYAPLLGSMVFHGFLTPPAGVKVPPTWHASLETCDLNGINRWLIEMARLTGQTVYLDALEWLLYNVYLPRDLPDGTVSPYGDIADKTAVLGIAKSVTNDIFHCCWNSVSLGHSYLPSWCYFTAPDGIMVNLYEPSTLDAEVDGIKVRFVQTTKYPLEGLVEIAVEPEKSITFALYFRTPGWCETTTVLVNETVEEGARLTAGSLVRLYRQWHKNDRVSLMMEMPAKVVKRAYAAQSTQATVERGPLILCVLETLNPGVSLESIVAFEESDGQLTLEPVDSGAFRCKAVTLVQVDGEPVRKTVPVLLTPFADAGAHGSYRVEFG